VSIETTAKELMEAMQPKRGPTAYDTQATVTRVDGDTLWVHIPGGVDETPIQRTINASEGDVVQVRVSNGSAFAMGNASAPPTDDTQAHVAQRQAGTAQATADEALELARLKVGYAEIDQAVIDSLEVNGINADWIDAGAFIVKDENDRIIFKADKDSKNVEIGSWNVEDTMLVSDEVTSGPYFEQLKIGEGQIQLHDDFNECVYAMTGSGHKEPEPGGGWTTAGLGVFHGIGTDPNHVNNIFGFSWYVDGTKRFWVDAPLYTYDSIIPSTNGDQDLGAVGYRWNNVYANNVNGHPPVVRQTKTVTGTTTAAGNLALGLAGADYGILSVKRTDANGMCTPYIYAAGAGGWYVHITNIAASPTAITNTAVTLEVDYYAK